MSNSELVVVRKENQEEAAVGFGILLRTTPSPELRNERKPAATGERSEEKDCDVVVVETSDKGSEKPPPLVRVLPVTDGSAEEDGFRTPTSSDHRIAGTEQCPPAPRKPKPVRSSSSGSATKRKASTDDERRDFDIGPQLDLSREVEALFPPQLLADFHRKIKKARTEDFP